MSATARARTYSHIHAIMCAHTGHSRHIEAHPHVRRTRMRTHRQVSTSSHTWSCWRQREARRRCRVLDTVTACCDKVTCRIVGVECRLLQPQYWHHTGIHAIKNFTPSIPGLGGEGGCKICTHFWLLSSKSEENRAHRQNRATSHGWRTCWQDTAAPANAAVAAVVANAVTAAFTERALTQLPWSIWSNSSPLMPSPSSSLLLRPHPPKTPREYASAGGAERNLE